MRLAIFASLALLPVLAQAQAAPAGTQTLASVSQPKLAGASAPAPTPTNGGVAVVPVTLRDVVHLRLNADLREHRGAGELVYNFYGDAPQDDARVQAPQIIHAAGRTLPVAEIQDAQKTDVAVRVIVNAAGVPLYSSIAHSTGQAAIDNATLAAVREYRFSPAKVDGIPVDADLTLTIHLEKN